jgi:hypothetical protein
MSDSGEDAITAGNITQSGFDAGFTRSTGTVSPCAVRTVRLTPTVVTSNRGVPPNSFAEIAFAVANASSVAVSPVSNTPSSATSEIRIVVNDLQLVVNDDSIFLPSPLK